MSIYRKRTGALPIWMLISALLGFLMIALLLQFSLAWLSYKRAEPYFQHTQQLSKVQSFIFDLQRNIASQLTSQVPFTDESKAELDKALETLLQSNNYLNTATPENLKKAREAFRAVAQNPQIALLDTLDILRQVYTQESAAHQEGIKAIYQGALIEIEIAIITLVVLPVSAFFLLIITRKRIFIPLEQMRYIMSALGDRQYQCINLQKIDPTFRPLAENFNQLVTRLSELELEHLQYQEQLESKVESAARVLVEQHRSLANTEKLAALGEVMAQFAHELRNPLMGIKLACESLGSEFVVKSNDRDTSNRFALVSKEIDRVIHLLNSLLSGAQHEPESRSSVNVKDSVDDLLTLTRYQVPANIELRVEGPDDLCCWLPDVEMRQALLNLVLNAQHALGENGGLITVNITLEGDLLTLSVRDTGPGFPSDVLDNGISAFKTHRVGGTGLGLSMVQRFARNQDGSVEIHNRETGGAEVSIKIKCARNHD